MKTIWLIRHGESLANAGFATPDPATIPLTQKGHDQSRNVSTQFRQKPDLIVYSPFTRTQETAAPTIARFPDVPVEMWQVQEFTYLCPENFKDTTSAQRRPMVEKYWKSGDADHIDGPGAESFSQMATRARVMLKQLEEADGDFIAVFSHGQFIRTVKTILEHPNASDSEIMKIVFDADQSGPIPNCSITCLELDQGKFTITAAKTADNDNGKPHASKNRKQGPGL